VFIEGAKHALMADPAYRAGVFTERPVSGFRAMGPVYAAWRRPWPCTSRPAKQLSPGVNA
jgi:hypothetical protein